MNLTPRSRRTPRGKSPRITRIPTMFLGIAQMRPRSPRGARHAPGPRSAESGVQLPDELSEGRSLPQGVRLTQLPSTATIGAIQVRSLLPACIRVYFADGVTATWRTGSASLPPASTTRLNLTLAVRFVLVKGLVEGTTTL